MSWETELSFDGKLCQKYSYKKLSKSDNWFSSYIKNVGDFFETQYTLAFYSLDVRYEFKIITDLC